MNKIIYILVAIAMILMAGCNHKEYPGQTNEGHIENFINNEDKGIDLFRVTGIYPPTPYQWPGDPATYYDSVLSVGRSFSTVVSDTSVDYASLGWLFEGVSRVTDTFLVRTFKISGTDTTFTDGTRLLVRSGYFLKLGRDADYNFGWDLWGMGYWDQQLPQLIVGIWFADSTSMRGDFDLYNNGFLDLKGGRYRALTDFKTIPDSSECRVDVSIRQVGAPARYYTRVSYPTDTGYASTRLELTDSEHGSGTMILREKPVLAYDFLVISIYDTQTKAFVRSWTAPYRVNPIN